jgi:hypothetical protein
MLAGDRFGMGEEENGHKDPEQLLFMYICSKNILKEITLNNF